MQTKQIFNINDFENLDWRDHNFFENAIAAQVFFDNGYGASIITQTNGEKAKGFIESFRSAYGSHEDGTYEVAVIKGNKESSGFHQLENIEDIDFNENDVEEYIGSGGIWANMDLMKTIEKINLIACL
jgi:hypothetical protein